MSSAPAQMATDAASHTAQEGPKQHTRTYQACIPCRRRKVRCDLGPVDAPHEPPCVRCRRESKDCYFSATRRKRRPTDGEDDADEEELEDYEARNGRKRVRTTTSSNGTPTRSHPPNTLNASQTTETSHTGPLTPGGSIGQPKPLTQPGSQTTVVPKIEDEDEARVANETAAQLQKNEIFSGHDALNVLYHAAINGDHRHNRAGSSSSTRPSLTANTPGSYSSFASPQATGPFQPALRTSNSFSFNNNTDAPLAGAPEDEDAKFQNAYNAWSQFRFVRGGWFTAQEGMAYVDYFYKHLLPLTPIIPPDFRDISTHESLLRTEPLLAVTILTVASRYMKLAGPGSNTRPHAIHSKLWDFLKDAVARIIWGQEQFGGGFCGAGAQPASDINPLKRKGLRTLGTVEALLLLTEWHPRALHFPPGTDDDEIMSPLKEELPVELPRAAIGPGGQRVDSWLEPCWRSDRMCWMLLGNAFQLAAEIGVFDETTQSAFAADNQGTDMKIIQNHYARRGHIRNLLQVYITQSAGRIGLTSMLPRSYMSETFHHSVEQRFRDRVQRFKSTNMDPQTTSVAAEAKMRSDPHEMMLHFWVDLAAIMHEGNYTMFASRRETRELIRKGEYTNLIKGFQPLLADWRQRFDACEAIPVPMRHIMLIEFEYARVYLHCLALQAVVERCTHNSPPRTHVHLVNGKSSSPDKEGGAIPPTTIMKWIGNDRQYIQQVVNGCRVVLRIVTEGLQPDDYLRHVPVRTYFRIISVMMILVKTFAIGSFEDEIGVSLGLMEQAVAALKDSIVDDVHAMNSFVDLATILLQRVRSRFIRLSANNKTTKSRGASKTPPPPQRREVPHMPPPKAFNNHRTTNGQAPAQWGNNFNNQFPYFDTRGFDTRSGFQNPLHGISTESYDLGSNNVSIVPPPSYGTNGPYDAPQMDNGAFGYAGFGIDGGNDNNTDWLTLPLDNLIQMNHGAEISQTTYGPDVGGLDLLDVLLDPTSGPVNYQQP